MLGVGDLAQKARHRRYLGLGRRLLALDLVAHGGDGARVGADEDDPGLLERDRERLALRQEAVAGMDGLGAGLAAGLHDVLDDEIGLRGGRGTNGDGFVRHLHMQGVPVGLRVDCDRLDAELARGLDDPTGDLAPVGNQDFLEHARPIVRKGPGPSPDVLQDRDARR